MNPMVQSEGLCFRYHGGEGLSLDGVTLAVQPGECVVLCGKSGSGKTTFSRFLNGLCPMFFAGELSGSCRCAGLEAGQAAIEDYVPLVGSVFQNPKTQYFNIDTTAELAFPCENTGLPSGEIRRRVAECAAQFGIEPLLGRSIFRLSGGEKQRIAFAAASMLHPRLLVLDEPTSNLDQAAIEALARMVAKMKAQGVTIVLAEHRLAWLRGIADRYLLFEDGRLAGQWPAAEFERLPLAALYGRGLRATDLAPLVAQTHARAAAPPPAGQPLLAAQGLAVGYGGKTVCTVERLALYPGEIVGLMGHNGIGKSTLAKTLCGLQKPLAGQILWRGEPAAPKALARRCFLVMQDVNYQLFSDSVQQEVLLGAANPGQCQAVLASLGLDALAGRHPMSLSGGQKQRVAIAAAMLAGRELVLLDEPTSGLDHHHMTQVGLLLRQLKEQGRCVLVITHDVELTAQWCDRVIELQDKTA